MCDIWGRGQDYSNTMMVPAQQMRWQFLSFFLKKISHFFSGTSLPFSPSFFILFVKFLHRVRNSVFKHQERKEYIWSPIHVTHKIVFCLLLIVFFNILFLLWKIQLNSLKFTSYFKNTYFKSLKFLPHKGLQNKNAMQNEPWRYFPSCLPCFT